MQTNRQREWGEEVLKQKKRLTFLNKVEILILSLILSVPSWTSGFMRWTQDPCLRGLGFKFQCTQLFSLGRGSVT